LLAKGADIYRPRLQQLGLTEKAGEPDDDRLLRNTLIGMFAQNFKDPAVRAEMNKQGRAVLGIDGDGKLNADATSRERRGVALSVAVDEGGTAAFDLAEKHFRTAQDPVLRSQLLGALSGTKDAKLGERVRAMVLEPGLLRRNEIYVALGGQTQEETRAALSKWLDANFDAAAARLAPGGAGLAGFDTGAGCSVAEADAFEAKYTARLKDMEGGPMQVKQTVERIKLCAAAKDARKGQAAAPRRQVIVQAPASTRRRPENGRRCCFQASSLVAQSRMRRYARDGTHATMIR
jgi:alanyl aminopeptidase